MQDFISGKDQSLAHAHEIEGLLIKDFRDNEYVFDVLSEPVARYMPGGGVQLYDEFNLTQVFKDFLLSRNS